jgi:hypothetical protein
MNQPPHPEGTRAGTWAPDWRTLKQARDKAICKIPYANDDQFNEAAYGAIVDEYQRQAAAAGWVLANADHLGTLFALIVANFGPGQLTAEQDEALVETGSLLCEPYYDASAPGSAPGGTSERPTIVCLCGSTRFSAAFHEANLRETLGGKIVLTIGCDFKGDDALGLGSDDKARLDELHLRKIDLADEVLILNCGGYIGESTRRELDYAIAQGKRVRFLEPEFTPGEEQ